jgi:pyruvate/2-oxoacid:ferredoxin oxidoreductase alpha subunit
MAVRHTGFALLASASVQEAHDLALVAQGATPSTRVPFVHFFDGFRTSHELNTIELLSDDELRAMVPEALIRAHRGRGLTPERPFIRGTAQNPDVFFQARETVNPFYARIPDIVQDSMDKLGERTGGWTVRHLRLGLDELLSNTADSLAHPFGASRPVVPGFAGKGHVRTAATCSPHRALVTRVLALAR